MVTHLFEGKLAALGAAFPCPPSWQASSPLERISGAYPNMGWSLALICQPWGATWQSPGQPPSRKLPPFDVPESGLYNSYEGFCKEVELPLYEYACSECGGHVEKIQKFSDPPLTKCAKCGGRLKRLLSSPAIQFKGTGWYVTDYARKSSSLPAGNSRESGNGDKGKGSESAKKETPTSKKSEVKSQKSE